MLSIRKNLGIVEGAGAKDEGAEALHASAAKKGESEVRQSCVL